MLKKYSMYPLLPLCRLKLNDVFKSNLNLFPGYRNTEGKNKKRNIGLILFIQFDVSLNIGCIQHLKVFFNTCLIILNLNNIIL